MTTNRPPGASVPTDGAPAPLQALTGAVEVLPDKSGRVGILSYQVPDTMTVHPGDAVTVPFGARSKTGLVIGPAPDPAKATKAITEVHGKRCDPRELHFAKSIAKYHFADLAVVLGRLSPSSGRGADPVTDQDVRLAPDVPKAPQRGVNGATRRLLVRAPLVRAEHVAAHEAERLTRSGGQVLILCPTTASVTATLAAFTSGAQRLDARARRGAWKGFTQGTVAVGIGTRSAALYAADQLAGIIVVDEEHPGHNESAQPHTNARDLASARARALGIALTLISAAPTPAALGAGVAVGTVGTRADWPTMRLIDRGNVDPVDRWAPPAVRAAIAAENKAGRTPWVVAQRRGTVRRCPRCGTPRPCPLCATSLCRHQDPDPCPRCHTDLPAKVVGWDASRIADLLNTAPVLTADGTVARPGVEKVKVVSAADLPKGKNVGLVIIFDVDAALAAPDLIPDSFANHLIVTAAHVAGRDGSVIALTDTPQAATLTDLFGPRDQLAVARRTLTAAQAAHLPPFGRLVTIRCGRERPPKVDTLPGHVLGPTKVAGEWETLVRVPADQLLALAPHIARLRRGGKIRVTVT